MDWIYSWKNSGYNSARVTSGGSVTTRPCLINGGMPKGERFFRQSRQIFAGGLTPGKRMQRRVAEKDPSFGRFGIFQTRPKYRSTTYPPALGATPVRKLPQVRGRKRQVIYLDGVASATLSFYAGLQDAPGTVSPFPPGTGHTTGQWCCNECPPADGACRLPCRAWTLRFSR